MAEGTHVKIFPWKSVEAQKAEEGAEGVTVRWLLTKEKGADNFYMRLFEMEPGGHTPLHNHPWEHEVLILKGSGTVSASGEKTEFYEGDVILLPSGEEHQFRNTGKDTVRFLCLIPAT